MKAIHRFLNRRWLLSILSGVYCLGLSAGELRKAPPLMRDFVGINGHTIQFRPQLYRPVCGLVRDYHPVEWDLGHDTTVLPAFPRAKNGVDWQPVYGSWRTEHWEVDVCLMFESIKQPDWQDLETSARAYGQAFAREFGPSGTRKLVDSVEIGNEPGKWNDADYTRMLKAMAAGLRAGDPRMKIATCNLTTGKSGDYEKSVACLEDSLDLFDVLNVHTYAQLVGWPTWRRSFPEDPKLPHYLPDVEALCRWRDGHAPGKPVWITELGYDSSTKTPGTNGDFAKWIGVNDTQQAQWLVRSTLVFSSLPVERAYIYFFNDDDQPQLHGSSGVTRHFEPKPSFHALTHLQSVLGDCHFQSVITNDPGHLRIQEYRNDARKVVWAVWSPTGEGRESTVSLEHLPGKLVRAQRMPLDFQPVPESMPAPGQKPNQVQVTESPLYLTFELR